MKQKKTDAVYVSLDLKKIFLTPPNTKKEKILLLILMTLFFMFFFGPLTFSSISPIRAGLISAIPTVTSSWAWIVLLRFVGRKMEFCKEPLESKQPSKSTAPPQS